MEVEFKKNSLNFLYKFEFTNPLECLRNGNQNSRKKININNSDDYANESSNYGMLEFETKDNLESEKAQEAKKFCSENYGIILADMIGFPKEMINVKYNFFSLLIFIYLTNIFRLLLIWRKISKIRILLAIFIIRRITWYSCFMLLDFV